MNMNKKAAVELSIGTIVIIVLAMSMLILGIVLIQNIFSTSINVVDIADAQLVNQMNNLFGDDRGLVVYPDSKEMTAEIGEETAFAVGLKNLEKGADSTEKKFSYTVTVAERGNCQKSERELEDLIITGRELSPTTLAPGQDPVVRKVRLFIPEGFPICSFSYQIQSFVDNQPKLLDFMDVEIVA
jgi:hypothetical protein